MPGQAWNPCIKWKDLGKPGNWGRVLDESACALMV